MVDRSDLDAGDGPSSHRGGEQARRAELCRRIEHRFADDTLLELALRHRSWCSEHGGVESNERLEFLGDSVLGLVVTEPREIYTRAYARPRYGIVLYQQ